MGLGTPSQLEIPFFLSCHEEAKEGEKDMHFFQKYQAHCWTHTFISLDTLIVQSQ